MILIDTGPLTALFDPRDGQHDRCVQLLRGIQEPLATTVPVLTEAFHMLRPGSRGATRLRDFVLQGGLSVWFLDRGGVERAFELMEQYSDHPMDLADASLVTAAETLGTRKIFTIDRKDFQAYRVRRGHRFYAMKILS